VWHATCSLLLNNSLHFGNAAAARAGNFRFCPPLALPVHIRSLHTRAAAMWHVREILALGLIFSCLTALLPISCASYSPSTALRARGEPVVHIPIIVVGCEAALTSPWQRIGTPACTLEILHRISEDSRHSLAANLTAPNSNLWQSRRLLVWQPRLVADVPRGAEARMQLHCGNSTAQVFPPEGAFIPRAGCEARSGLCEPSAAVLYFFVRNCSPGRLQGGELRPLVERSRAREEVEVRAREEAPNHDIVSCSRGKSRPPPTTPRPPVEGPARALEAASLRRREHGACALRAQCERAGSGPPPRVRSPVKRAAALALLALVSAAALMALHFDRQ
jgi:hypothetical protein